MEEEKKITAAELKEENDAMEVELARSQEIQQKMEMSGKADAGQEEEVKTKEETLQTEAEDFMKEDE